jgi:hypothetical protein
VPGAARHGVLWITLGTGRFGNWVFFSSVRMVSAVGFRIVLSTLQGDDSCAVLSLSFCCCRCRVRQAPLCFHSTARSIIGTQEIAITPDPNLSSASHPQLPAAVSLAAGGVGIAIKRRDDAEGLLIYVEGRLSWRPLSFRATLISRELPTSPMRVLPVRVEHALDVPIQRPHDADAREHRRPVKSASIAACRSSASCSALGSLVMYRAASRRVNGGFSARQFDRIAHHTDDCPIVSLVEISAKYPLKDQGGDFGRKTTSGNETTS